MLFVWLGTFLVCPFHVQKCKPFSFLTCTHECSGRPSETRCSSDIQGWPGQRPQRSWRWAQSRSFPGRRSHHSSRRLLLPSGCSSTHLALWTYLSAKGWEWEIHIRWQVSWFQKEKTSKCIMYLPREWSLLHGPVQSAYSRTERAAAAESGVCRVFDRAPVAERQKSGCEQKVSLGWVSLSTPILLYTLSGRLSSASGGH